MKHISIATGNRKKFDDLRGHISRRCHDMKLRHLDIDIPELQTTDERELLSKKAEHVRSMTALPFIVDDVSCSLEGTNGFPGALTKQVLRILGDQALVDAFPEGRRIEVRCAIALSYRDEIHFFEGAVSGVIRHDANGIGNAGMPLDAIVYLPDQDRFLGDPMAVTHRRKAVDALCDFLVETEAREQREQEETARRWDARASAWPAAVKDASSYVHYESGYGRFDALLAKIMKTAESPICLDLGCGTGEVSRTMAAAGAAAVEGIDVSEEMIAQARISSQGMEGLSFTAAEIDDLDDRRTFDLIVSRGVVLSHLPRHRVIDFLAAITDRAHADTYAVFDFIQHLENGAFPNAGNKNAFSYGWLLRVMREFGWVPVAKDGDDDARVVIATFHRPFPDSLYFVTANPQKLLELRHATNIPHLHGCSFDLPELKHDDIAHIAEEKARQAFDLVGRPVISTDGGIFLDAYDGFPGPNSKQAATKLKPEGIVRLLASTENRRGIRKNAVAWFDGASHRTNVQEVPVVIAHEPRGNFPAYPMDRILIPVHADNPDGLTYAEMPVVERARFTELPELAAFIKLCR